MVQKKRSLIFMEQAEVILLSFGCEFTPDLIRCTLQGSVRYSAFYFTQRRKDYATAQRDKES